MPNFVPLSLKSLSEFSGKTPALPSPLGPESATASPAPTGFQPLAQVLPSIKPTAVPIGSTTPTPAAPAPGAPHQPGTVQLQRQDGHITGIRILCNCGQVIDLECLYEPG